MSKTNLNPELLADIKLYLLTGMPLKAAIQLSGLNEATYYKWTSKAKKGIPDYIEAVTDIEIHILYASVIDFNEIIKKDPEPITSKKCHRCNTVYSIDNFGIDKSRYDGYKHWCKHCEKKMRTENPEYFQNHHKKYYYANRTELLIQKKNYRLLNIDKFKEKDKNYYINNLEHKKQMDKKYRRNNADKIRMRNRRYDSTEAGRIVKIKSGNKRRRLGCNPINKHFKGSHYHHLMRSVNGTIDTDIGIYIPEKLHRSVWHNGNTGQGMEEINKLAIEWYLNTHNPDSDTRSILYKILNTNWESVSNEIEINS